MKPNTVRGRSTTVTLENLAYRLQGTQELLDKHPEQKALLEPRLRHTKEDIVRCVMQAYEEGDPYVPFNIVMVR